MLSCIDKQKMTQMGMDIFGSYWFYIIYGLVYQRTITMPYLNHQTQEMEHFQSSAGFAFLVCFLYWVIVELVACLMHSKDQNRKNTKVHPFHWFFCGLFSFLAVILFTEGIFQITSTLAFYIRSMQMGLGVVSSIFMCFKPQCSIKSTFVNILCVAGILYGAYPFWSEIEQIWIYSPDKWGGFYIIMISFASGCEAITIMLMTWICGSDQISEWELMRKVARWAIVLALGYVLAAGDFTETMNYCLTHWRFAGELAVVVLFYFLSQVFVIRSLTRMPGHVPLLISSTRNVFVVHLTYTLSIYKLTGQQIWGMLLTYACLVINVVYYIRKQQQIEVNKEQYKMVMDVEDLGVIDT